MHKSGLAVAGPAIPVLVPLYLPLATITMASLSHVVMLDCVAICTCVFMMNILYMYKGAIALYTASPIVEPPIMDSLRYGLPLYNGQTTCPWLTLPYILTPRDRQLPISRQQTEHVPP